MSSNNHTGSAGRDAAGGNNVNLTTNNNVLSDFTTPMFQSIDPSFDPQQHNNNVDLDDLFRECYFMDFPVPASFTDDNTNQSGVIPLPPVSSTAASATGGGSGSSSMIMATRNTPTPSSMSATPMTVVSSPKATGAGSLKRSADDMSAGGEEVLTEQQRLERRERNREHAKRSRLRKKFLLESLQEQIQGLQEQIEAFKDIISKELPDKAEQLFQTICGDKTKFTPLPMPSGFGPVKTLMEPDFRLMSALSGSQQNFAISDPSLPDNPIVYVSQGFLELTGYTLDQVLGRNCRFLQGPGTDQSAVEVIRKGINEGVDTSVCLLNYKADGTPFWNQFFVAALRDAENNVVNYVGVQCEVSKAVVEKHLGERAAAAGKK